ncbi:MAG: V-type ATP synthase subunit I [Firmicutes bacterium]|nr:V-type ATP synthase subunit I [Bacillota bacterium]
MPIVEMQRISLFAHQQEKDAVINILQELGIVELVDLKESSAWEEMKLLLEPEEAAEEVAQLESRLGEIRYCLDFFQRYFPVQKSFIEQFTGARFNITPEEYKEFVAKGEETDLVYRNCREVDEEQIGLRNEETRCHNLLSSLAPWAGFSLPLEQIKDTKRLRMQLSTVPADELPVLQKALAETVADYYLEVVSADRDLAYVFALYLQKESAEVGEIFKTYGATEVSFPGLTGTAAQSIEELDGKIAEIQRKREELRQRVEKLLIHRPHMMAYYDYLEGQRAQKEAIGNLARTENTFMLEGWVPAPLVSNLKKTLMQETETALLVSRDPEPGEDVPVLLQNGPVSDAYEVVTRMYSTPSRREIDPTPLMAPFFFVFFGMCLSDAGYGVILSLLAYFITRKIKLKGMGKQLIKLLFLGGVSAFLAGIVMGSYFGDLIKIEPLWFNPLDDPMRMLIVSCILGGIHIFTGMAVQAYQSIKRGRIWDAVFDQGLWYLFLIGLVLLFLPQGNFAGKWMSITGAVGLVLTQGRSQKGIFKKLSSGLVSLYDVTGFLSDVLSYSRLLALGLATGVIASAINTMAGLLTGSVVGVIVMIIILLGGHSFNLIINTLGAYVHTSRLQYIEFFGKFFEGGGRSFQPFCKTTKFVEIEERKA